MSLKKEGSKFKINKEITALDVRVVFEDGTSKIMKTVDALKLATESGVDLIEISENTNPPICKIIEVSKFMYRLNKKKKESKPLKMKEIKFTSTISENDISYRIKKLKEFLSLGHTVKVTLVYKGRTISHSDIGENKFKEIIKQVSDVGIPINVPKLEGRYLFTYLKPKK